MIFSRTKGSLERLPRVLVLALLALLLTGGRPRPEQKPSKDTASTADIQAREDLAKIFPGRILFDSNRGAGFGIFAIDSRGQKLETIADSREHEMYPDVSPDGKWIVFARSDSLSKHATSEIRIVSLSGHDERKLADNATFPTFSADGLAVYFERNRESVMKIDIKSGKETELFPKGNPEWTEVAIVKPHVSPDGKFVTFISEQPRRWSAWYADLTTGKAAQVGSGCEPTWYPGSTKIAWVGGKTRLERSGISSFELSTGKVETVQDSGPPRGHEYFPSVTGDSRFLLYAAARPGEHEPTTANYQIFVKDLTTSRVTRITFDPHTNRWPKLLPFPLLR